MTAKKLHMYPVNDAPPALAKEPIPGGYYIKARCIQDSAIAHAAPHVREIWDWLIKEANYTDRKTHGTLIKRGQLFTDYNEIIDALSWKEGFIKKGYKKHHVDYAMRWLREELMITTAKTTRGLIVTVCNYEYYQNPDNYEKDTDYDTITTRLRQPTDTIQKKEKKAKKGSKEFIPPTLEEVKQYFRDNGYREEVAEKAFGTYNSADWHDTRGNKIANWKQKMHSVWFDEKNKVKEEKPVKEVDYDEFYGRPPVKSAFD